MRIRNAIGVDRSTFTLFALKNPCSDNIMLYTIRMKSFLFISILVSLISCKQDSTLTGEFQGFWATTFWTIELQENNHFNFTSSGHFGNTETTGKFEIKDSFLELLPDDESKIEMIFQNYRFQILGDSCLVDLDNGYDYCINRPDYWNSRKWNLIELEIVEGYPN